MPFSKTYSKTMRRLFLGLFLSFASFVRAQDFKFSHLTVNEGLSQSVINCIMQDDKGFMWFGTQAGLNRYDGYSFEIYKRDPQDSNSLSNNFIYSLCEGQDGIIWIGTNGGGLNAFNPATKKYTHYINDPKNSSSLSSDVVRVIKEDKDGKLWIGTDEGLNRLDPKTGKFERFKNNPNDGYSIAGNLIFDLVEDAAGNIWAGVYGNGLSMFDKATRRFFNYQLSESDLSKFYPEFLKTDLKKRSQCLQIRSLLFSDNDHIWIGTNGGGIQVFNTRTNSFERVIYPDETASTISGNRVLSLCDDLQGNTWLGVYENGIDVLNKKTNTIQHYVPNDRDVYALNSTGVKCIYCDRNGNVWMGTNGEGINVYFTSTSTIPHIRRSERPGVGTNTLASSAILSVMEDNSGLLWIGTSGGGLSTLDRKTDTYVHHPDLSTATNNSVLSLMQSSDGKIWVGTYGGGLNSYDPITKKIKLYGLNDVLIEGTILCIAEEPITGAIWFGTFGAGIYRLDPKTDSMQRFTSEKDSLTSDYIYSLYFDKGGNLWVGTRAGGAMIRNSITGKFSSFEHNDKDKKSLSNNIVYCMTEDLSGNMWLGTANGLDRFNRKEQNFDIWYEGDGLPSDNIYAILPDANGNLWMSHNKGITRFDISPAAKVKFKNYGKGAGVQPAEFNQGAYFRNKNGELFFGGQAGLNIIDTKKVETNYAAPPVYITSYKRLGKEIKLDSTIENTEQLSLTWRDNNFMFELAALDFVDPSKNQYQYKLEGSDEDWSPVTTNRYVSYTNLPGGHYSLVARVADCNGNWSKEKVLIRIYIQPPFWKTNWFYTLCVLFLIAGVFGFIRYRTGAIRKEKRVLEAKVAERTYELAQKNADITSSIQYAKRIQSAILPELQVIYEHLPESFVLYKPKDIVSGDFYWFAQKNGINILAVGDCTGHGVPGALMSMIGHNLLNQIVQEKGIVEPDQILFELNIGVRAALKQDHNEQDTTDGMDIAICCFDTVRKEVLYAGALRPLIVIRKSLLTKIESDRFPIGGSQDTRDKKFTLHRFPVESGDLLYMFSDGFADQFGGEKGKKFMVKNLLQKLTLIQDKPMKEQALLLEKTFDDWKAGYQQVDDVLVVGVRIP